MRAYFENKNSRSGTASTIAFYNFGVSATSLFLVALVILGWIALGERANISRRDINTIEISAIVVGIAFTIASVRTAFGIRNRDETSWAWAQWTAFVGLIVGFFILLSTVGPQIIGLISNAQPTVPSEAIWQATLQFGQRSRTIFVNGIMIFALVLFLSNFFIYRMTVANTTYDDKKVEKAQGAFSTAIDDMTPSQFIRHQLAESPSAGAIIGFILILLIFATASDTFRQPPAIASMLTNISTKGIVAIGITILMISGEFDLSVGSMLGAVALFFMLFMTEGVPFLGITQPFNPILSMFLAILVGLLLGFINGFILVRTGIPSFIVTLGTLLIYRAIPLVAIPGGRILRYKDYYAEFPTVTFPTSIMVGLGVILVIVVIFIGIRTLPKYLRQAQLRSRLRGTAGIKFGTTLTILAWVRLVMAALLLLVLLSYFISFTAYHLPNISQPYTVGLFDILNGQWTFTLEKTAGLFVTENPSWWQIDPLDFGRASFRNAIIWWILLVLLFNTILNDTRYGNSVFAVGGNSGAARANGINVNRVKIFNFMLVGFLVSLAAIFEVARNPGVDPLKGLGWELEMVAMTVIGGTLLSGGYGSVLGTILGGLIFAMLNTGLVQVGMNARLFEGVIGVILIVAVILNTTVRRIPTK